MSLWKNSRTVLGMNARNLKYVRPFNLAKARKIADQKLRCKRVLTEAGIPVPKLIAKIRTYAELENFDWSRLPDSFALKPNRGFGGEGIVVVYARKKGRDDAWVKADGTLVTRNDLQSHIENILDGSFSLSNTPDIAFFEERLKLLKLFKPYTFKGIPDIRVIVFNRVPVMAMLRLPTKESKGKANLQQGAIGVGIDLSNGTTTSAIIGKGRVIDYVPGTRLFLSGIKIPQWRSILRMAVHAQEITGLGFLGADIAIDRELGPVVLELNARPGLSIQLANQSGLKERLERVQGLKVKDLEHGVRIGMNLFGGEIEESIEELSGRRIIGSVVKVKLIGKDGKEKEIQAKVDTGADSSSLDRSVAIELGYEKAIQFFDAFPKPQFATREEANQASEALTKEIMAQEPDLVGIVSVVAPNGIQLRPKVRLGLSLYGTEIPAAVTLTDRSHLEYPMILGRRHLSKFLIDVTK